MTPEDVRAIVYEVLAEVEADRRAVEHAEVAQYVAERTERLADKPEDSPVARTLKAAMRQSIADARARELAEGS